MGNPALSPDRKTLMFEVGNLSTLHGGYTICLWDFSKRSIVIGKELVAFPDVVWSPDSSYIGYFVGGDKSGRWSDPNYPPHLHILNVKTGEVQIIPNQVGVTSWAWTNTGTLLFTRFEGESLPPQSQQKSDIFEFTPQSKTSTILLQNASRPSPSPDNRWVAFVSSEVIPMDNADPKSQSPLLKQCALYDRQTHRIFRAMAPIEDAVQSYLWDAASQHLFSFQVTNSDMKDGKQIKHCAVKVVEIAKFTLVGDDISSLNWNKITEFDCVANQANSTIDVSTLQITRDGRALIYKIVERLRNDQGSIIESVNALNLTSGQSEVLFRKSSDLDTSVGFSWTELPASAVPSKP